MPSSSSVSGTAYRSSRTPPRPWAPGTHTATWSEPGNGRNLSFFPSKNLGGFGDGGMCSTDDPDIAGRLRIDRVHGMEPKYYHQHVGVNSRLDALQAAVLSVKLDHLESWHEARQRNAAFYDRLRRRRRVDSRTPLADGSYPWTPYALPAPARHIYNQYVIRVPADMRSSGPTSAR